MTDKEQIDVLKSEVEHLKARVALLETLRPLWLPYYPIWIVPPAPPAPAVQPMPTRWNEIICGQQPGMLSTSGH
jgi:hypothetical protein